jgi:hypothetical protein
LGAKHLKKYLLGLLVMVGMVFGNMEYSEHSTKNYEASGIILDGDEDDLPFEH